MFYSFVSEIRQIPFIRIVIPFAVGIIIQTQTHIFPNNIFWASVLLLMPFVLLLFFNRLSYKNRFWAGIIVYSGLLTAGGMYAAVQTTVVPKFPEGKVSVKGIILEPLAEKANSFQTVIETEYFASDSNIVPFNSKILSYIQKDSSFIPDYGDGIIFQTYLSEMQNPGNPYEFDYKQYLLDRGITGQCYIETEHAEIIEHGRGDFLIGTALRLRTRLAETYREYGIENEDLAVLSALTLGDKSELNPETREAYSKAGAMHILAVSGLHVGIIYFVLNFLLKFLNQGKLFKLIPLRIVKAVLLLIGVWFFALLTGLSPSVMRASVMFSFVIAGNAGQRRINIYNSLAASAFFLLLYDSTLINAVGFQLSYLAVLAIVYIQPRLVKLLTFRNKFGQKVWELTTVSVAAQIGTAPLALYYFHIFPNLFFITNLIVIPLATFIVYGAALLLSFSFVPYLSDAAAFILKWLTKALNYSVSFIEQVPASAAENISFTMGESLIWYLIIISSLLFWQYRKPRQFLGILSLFIVLLSLYLTEEIQAAGKRQLTVYNVRNSSLIQFTNNDEVFHIADSSLTEKSFRFAAQNRLLQERLKNRGFSDLHHDTFETNAFFTRHNEFLICGNKTIVLLTAKEQSQYTARRPAKTDCVIITGNEYFYMADIKQLYQPDIVVFDSSNKLNRIERWKEECDTLDLACYSVPEQGAFSLDCSDGQSPSEITIYK